MVEDTRGYDGPDDGPEYADVVVQLTGLDGNVFSIIGRVSRALTKAGHRRAAEAYTKAAFDAGSYDEVLRLTMEVVDVR